MPLSIDSSTITHSIQLSVAPVFLLTAVAGMIGAVAGRLARIIDRARVVEERAPAKALNLNFCNGPCWSWAICVREGAWPTAALVC